MKKFLRELGYELKRSIPRTLYFLRHGQLHPEVAASYYYPMYTLVAPAPYWIEDGDTRLLDFGNGSGLVFERKEG